MKNELIKSAIMKIAEGICTMIDALETETNKGEKSLSQIFDDFRSDIPTPPALTTPWEYKYPQWGRSDTDGWDSVGFNYSQWERSTDAEERNPVDEREAKLAKAWEEFFGEPKVEPTPATPAPRIRDGIELTDWAWVPSDIGKDYEIGEERYIVSRDGRLFEIVNDEEVPVEVENYKGNNAVRFQGQLHGEAKKQRYRIERVMLLSFYPGARFPERIHFSINDPKASPVWGLDNIRPTGGAATAVADWIAEHSDTSADPDPDTVEDDYSSNRSKIVISRRKFVSGYKAKNETIILDGKQIEPYPIPRDGRFRLLDGEIPRFGSFAGLYAWDPIDKVGFNRITGKTSVTDFRVEFVKQIRPGIYKRSGGVLQFHISDPVNVKHIETFMKGLSMPAEEPLPDEYPEWVWITPEMVGLPDLPPRKYKIYRDGSVWNMYSETKLAVTHSRGDALVGINDSKLTRTDYRPGNGTSSTRHISLGKLMLIAFRSECSIKSRIRIGFKDGNRFNCAIDNLYMIDITRERA